MGVKPFAIKHIGDPRGTCSVFELDLFITLLMGTHEPY